MAVRVQVRVGVDGPELHALADRAGAAELAAEARRLQDAVHPGVVAVLGSAPTGDGGWELRLAHGGPSLAAVPSLPLPVAARIVGAVARTLADLHDRGVVHGRLARSRILWAGGAPLLTGFAPAATEAVAPTPADDVAALGAVLAELVAAAGETPAPGWREPRGLRRQRAALVALAAEARDPVPGRRPTAARVAAALDRLEPEDVGPQGLGPPTVEPASLEPEVPAARSRRRRGRPVPAWAGAAVVAAATLAVVGGAVVLRSPAPDPADPPRTPSAPSTTSAPAACGARAGAPVEADGTCPYALEVRGGSVLVDGERFVVGRPDDDIAVGAWHCSGPPTAMVLRPGTGEVLELDLPAPPAGPRVVRSLHVRGAVALVVGGDACPTVAASTDAGEELPLDGGSGGPKEGERTGLGVKRT